MPPQKHEEGMDILKFFIGVMSLLTVLVAGFAGYNWSKASTLEEEVDAAQESLRTVQKIAGNPDFKKAVARSKLEKQRVSREYAIAAWQSGSDAALERYCS